MRAQLLRVPVASLPPGLTSLHAMHVQLQPDWSGQHTHASQQQQQQQLPDPGHLLSVFGELQELDWTHCDHATADKLLEVVLPHCTKLQLLHLSGPGEGQGWVQCSEWGLGQAPYSNGPHPF